MMFEFYEEYVTQHGAAFPEINLPIWHFAGTEYRLGLMREDLLEDYEDFPKS